MKELDFDELDRAVSSLMSDTTGSTPDSETPKEKTLDIPSSTSTASAPSFDALQPDIVKKAITQPVDDDKPVVSAAPAIRRSSGRFMDVVHPSSDMKQPTPPKMTTRQGVNISPTPSPLAVPSTASKVTNGDTAKERESTDDATHNWPDPLDMSESQPVDSEPDTAPDIAPTNLVEEDKAPLTSPFLSDAKVEKRPLGGAVTTVQPSETSADTATGSPEQGAIVADGASPEDQEISNPIDFEAPLPEELQSNLVAIESGEAETVTPETPSAATVPVVAEKQAVPEPPAKALIPDHFADENAPKGPASIAQQYKEEPKTGDQTNGAIYDTEAYHKPLAHPAKKSSGWLWIIWIILILAIGAGIGAALYYLGIVK